MADYPPSNREALEANTVAFLESHGLRSPWQREECPAFYALQDEGVWQCIQEPGHPPPHWSIDDYFWKDGERPVPRETYFAADLALAEKARR